MAAGRQHHPRRRHTGTGGATGTGGTQGGIQCVGNGAGLKAVLRDFQPTWMGLAGPSRLRAPRDEARRPLNFFNMVETGIVQPRIDEATRKPMYAGGPAGHEHDDGAALLPELVHRTCPASNMTIDYVLPFVETPPGSGIYVFDKAPFLPVDDGANCPVMPQTPCLLGNSRNYPTHNYALTLEFHTKFVYKPGISFLFSGDDDVWVFVNGSLAIDLGGIHQRTEARLNLDSAQPPLDSRRRVHPRLLLGRSSRDGSRTSTSKPASTSSTAASTCPGKWVFVCWRSGSCIADFSLAVRGSNRLASDSPVSRPRLASPGLCHSCGIRRS